MDKHDDLGRRQCGGAIGDVVGTILHYYCVLFVSSGCNTYHDVSIGDFGCFSGWISMLHQTKLRHFRKTYFDVANTGYFLYVATCALEIL